MRAVLESAGAIVSIHSSWSAYGRHRRHLQPEQGELVRASQRILVDTRTLTHPSDLQKFRVLAVDEPPSDEFNGVLTVETVEE